MELSDIYEVGTVLSLVRVVRFAEVDELKLGESVDDEEAFGDTEEGFDGLIDVQHADNIDVDLSMRAPILCLSGTDMFEDEAHVDGCGHGIPRDVWGTFSVT
ncbi:hypothetical protein E1B28_001689 [Marasmius oreades]|uniref:Uncharacterized protein n=1 Tax=Marasmius oreades TaxID=181124 RepID=A0A9P7V417_9AGAR|nr:uncharacterized protein E1B28_001689 [Marasmius oreades]KAG7099888.1 hypothetical protein E1B28_001689 [Marasmius oreades]